MSTGNQHKSPADALAAILGTGSPSSTTTDDANPAATTVETEAAADADPAVDDLQQDGAEAQLQVVEDLAESPARRQRQRRGPPRLGGQSGGFLRIVGLLLFAAGGALTVLERQGHLPPAVTSFGLDGSLLLAVGAVAYMTGMVRRQAALSQVRADALTFQQQEAQLDMQSNLQYLIEQQRAHAERPPAEGEELERVLAALQRQDDKVNNVSRALKMYGKPLMEIANQGADIGAQVNQLKGHVEALLASLQQGFTRVETAVRNQSTDLGPIERATAETAADLQRTLTAFGERLPTAQAMQQLQQQLVRVEASVQATSQRLDDSEVRKSLLRLEDTTKVQSKKLEELARQDALQSETQRLERQLDASIGKLGNAVEQVRSKNLGGLETTVRDIQRELASLATSVAYIQQAVKNGGGRSLPATAPSPAAPMPTTAVAETTAPKAEPVATAAPLPAGAAPAKPAPSAEPIDTKGLNDAQAGVAQNRTGAREANGKNLLGAIAKLKKMKG